MSRSTRPHPHRALRPPPHARGRVSRALRFEPLEDRRLLSITVNMLVDEADGSIVDGDISLRDAIALAPPGETIDFSVTGTINLTGLGDLVINKNLTINGPGASLLTIRAFDPSAAVRDGRRVFNVDDGNLSTFKDVFISSLTLTGGDVNGQGGAIRNASENLTVTACTISGNTSVSGGGLHNNAGHLSVSGCTISGNTTLSNGAGIETLGGSLNVAESTISGNSTPSGGSGGGIHSSSSTATIDSSTISGNSANYGGGINHVGTGSGILMTITNSTISSNSARRDGGGVSAVFSDVIVRHSTITLNKADSDSNGTGNGGGVFVNSVLTNATIDHTIVAGNLRQVSTRDDVFGSVVASSAFNLVGVNTGLAGITNGTNGNQIGTAGSPINPLLVTLADNAGPTFTHALLAGSPAIDAGNAAFSPPPLNDQRGAPFVRVFDGDGAGGARIDIGAYERRSLNLVVDTLADENDGDYSAGDLSLREATDLAFGSIGTITFAPSLTSGGPATILLTMGKLRIRSSVTITGPGANLLTIDASGNDPTPTLNNADGSQVFHIDDGNSNNSSDVAISGLTLTGGDFIASGGGILSFEDLTVTGCTISGNSASGGGGIASGGTLTINDSTISGNSASSRGGGIGSSGASTTISNSTISGNTALALDGGGVSNYAGILTITGSTISGNSAFRFGGGILSSFDNVTVRHSTITGNRADSTSTDNYYGFYGGGITTISGTVTLDHAIVAGNFRAVSARTDVLGAAIAHYSLIGDDIGATITDNGGNQVGTGGSPIDPLLGPLVNNGGPTKTHALLVGSPALDMGDPSFAPPPDFDQRGSPYTRVFDGNGIGGARIDIGAFEAQPHPLPGDYNRDGSVDTADYVVWRKQSGSQVPLFSGADGDGDSSVDPDDYGVWSANFGNTLGSGSGAVVMTLAAMGTSAEVSLAASFEPTPSEEREATAAGPLVIVGDSQPDTFVRSSNRSRTHFAHERFAASALVARHEALLLASFEAQNQKDRGEAELTAPPRVIGDAADDSDDTLLDAIDQAFDFLGAINSYAG